MYKLLVHYVSGRSFVRKSLDYEKLMSKAHELIEIGQANWVMVSNETTHTILLKRTAPAPLYCM